MYVNQKASSALTRCYSIAAASSITVWMQSLKA